MKFSKKVKKKAVALLLTVLLILSIGVISVGAVPATPDESVETTVAQTVEESITETSEVSTPDETVQPSVNSGNYGFWIGLGAIVVGGLIATAVIGYKAKKDEDEDE